MNENPFEIALRQLAESGRSEPESVIFHDADGTPVKAQEILDSFAGDGVVANRYVEAVNRVAVQLLERATRPVATEPSEEEREAARQELRALTPHSRWMELEISGFVRERAIANRLRAELAECDGARLANKFALDNARKELAAERQRADEQENLHLGCAECLNDALQRLLLLEGAESKRTALREALAKVAKEVRGALRQLSAEVNDDIDIGYERALPHLNNARDVAEDAVTDDAVPVTRSRT